MARLLYFLCALAVASPAYAQAPAPNAADAVTPLLLRLEQALQTHDRADYEQLFAPTFPAAQIADLADGLFIAGATRTVLQERDRGPLEGAPEGDGYRLVTELFVETPGRARILTISLDVRRPPGGDPASWRIVGAEGLTSVEGLFRLRVEATQFAAQNLTVTTEDFQLTLIEGVVFPVEGEEGTTGLVLIGRGEMRFSPTPSTEQGQLRIFSGDETLVTSFDTAYVRFNPSDYTTQVSRNRMQPTAVDPRLLRRAQETFAREGPKSFSLDLQDLSEDLWYLLPPPTDFLAEVQTRRFGLLTFARTGMQAEDITLFQRERRRTVALYSSQGKVAARGRFYTDDSLLEYDVLDYNIEAQVSPERQFIDGRARLAMRIRVAGTNTLTLRLAESLVVTNIVSLEYGRLLHLRVRNQSSIVVNLPKTLTRDADITLVISYSGRVPSQSPENEAVQVAQQDDFSLFQNEPSYLLSSRSYWYPQNAITDYATATMRLTLPPGYDCIASGRPVSVGGDVTLRDLLNVPLGRAFVFRADEPLRYLAFVASRFTRVASATVRVVEPDGGPTTDRVRETVALTVDANPRLAGRARSMLGTTEDIMRFYASLVGDAPYPSTTVALVESDLPGGHSPGYFAIINTPMPSNNGVTWRNDPAAFAGFSDFFVAHELAHQWWGQAVGWHNYHEQWLSEGFAQYFAALYAQKTRGEETFGNMLRQFRRWALAESDEGPVHLGYRLGHIKDDGRVFRALVYNKGAGVLHMLRRWVGEDVFFRGLRRFYDEQKFRKAGTDDLRLAFEAESGRPLERFFDRWIYEAELPVLRYRSAVEQKDLVVRIEQATDKLFDVPVTVSVTFANGRTQDVMVPVSEQQTVFRLPLDAPIRQVQINRDNAALAIFEEM